MPTEIRNIIFTTNEVLFAVKDFRQRKKDPLPTGSILACSIYDRPQAHAEIEMACDPDGQKLTIMLENEELAAALILFCINRKIPLPASAAKVLQVFDGKLSMVVTINPPERKLRQNIAKPADAPDKKVVA